ncbi:hypothetical protein CWB41_14125 [Methylovirgula ligni]|uniref:Aspartyl protease n=1 Tax=Methylovirgula ligni TaxID=569860 RepID=A0A3D9YMM9_9HYPH|nr:aspartyl protease family protein [Methylovirgula ligni]QAY96728.1 hypothetical protein CWB41_14125 [Methylovirgula ligni]REF83228.1 aspartyl protease [Methylovirgula ligni]
MPIAECGFPGFVPSIAGGRTIFQSGAQVLQMKGPTIMVEVGFEPGLFQPDPSQVAEAARVLAAAPDTHPTFKLVEALVDTGAGDSCIDEDLAQELNLPLIDQAKCSGVGGEHTLNVYLGHIRIPTLGQLRYGRFTGAKLKAGGQPHQTLIGRAQLSTMILIYDGRTGAAHLAV